MSAETDDVDIKKKPKKAKKAKKAKRAIKSATAKGTPWTFPKNVLEDAIRIAQAIEEKNAGNPMHAPDLAIAVGYKQSTDWRFGDLLRSAYQYGLVSGTGPRLRFHLRPSARTLSHQVLQANARRHFWQRSVP